jgi:Cu/Ag efflux pump CusA
MLQDIVKRPLLWVMLYAALIAYGIYALLNIHAEVLPQFNMPQVSVVAQLPGATTLDLEGQNCAARRSRTVVALVIERRANGRGPGFRQD